mmetsp:Transcript_100699/g.260098  ORF Transcript_100699/g.260098 Transcript_100699/m.260098 type:complete len:308 (+) Transcript_100699:872-1795(+)
MGHSRGVPVASDVVDPDDLLLNVVAHHVQAVAQLEEPAADGERLLERREGDTAIAVDSRVHAEAQRAGVGHPPQDLAIGRGVHPLALLDAAARAAHVDAVAEHNHGALGHEHLVHDLLGRRRRGRVVHGDAVHDVRAELHVVGHHAHLPVLGFAVILPMHSCLCRHRIRGQRCAVLPIVQVRHGCGAVDDVYWLRRVHHLLPRQRRGRGRRVVQRRRARRGAACLVNGGIDHVPVVRGDGVIRQRHQWCLLGHHLRDGMPSTPSEIQADADLLAARGREAQQRCEEAASADPPARHLMKGGVSPTLV